MLQLVYISTSRQQPTEAALQDILSVSRRNNGPAGLTGLLLAGGRRFLQVLEGPEEPLMATYDRISADPRHFALVRLGCRAIAERQFGDWAMAFEPGGAVAAPDDLRGTVAALTQTLTDPNLRAQFQGFAELHARAA